MECRVLRSISRWPVSNCPLKSELSWAPSHPMNPLQKSGSRRQLLGATGALVTGAWVAQAGPKRLTPVVPHPRNGAAQDLIAFRFSVTHAAVQTLLVTPGSSGSRLGDFRVLPATPIRDTAGLISGRLDATLTTTSVDFPAAGDEVRMGQLNFVFGAGDGQFAGSADQILVSGSGFYPGISSTIATGSTLVRPIIGGSGQYSGAIGSVRSEHLADGSWRHTFDFFVPAIRE